MPRASLIVSTYNQPAYLDLVLHSLALQSEPEFEIIVADDGSGPETRAVIEAHRRAQGRPVEHVWQDDRGFRKTVILNEAAAHARSDVLIFTDGDCLAHRHFVGSHLTLLEPGTFVVGRTARLSSRLTAGVTVEGVRSGRVQRMTAGKVLDGIFGRSKKMEFAFYLGNPVLFRVAQRIKKNRDLWGGNFSCRREDFVRVNGYNEEFLGWGKEDLELGIRFVNAGLRAVSAANLAVNFHLWHPKPPNRSANVPLQNELKRRVRETGAFRCEIGLDAHTRSPG